MRCPTLKELSLAPAGKTGWPWTEESKELPDTMPDGKPWPKISIITPSYNQGSFLEETIRSVLLQGYPDLEYIIIDGGSADNSKEIIKKYEKWLAFWVSEKDKGQSDAINKGFKHANGEIFAWLNSDDTYEPNALGEVAIEMNSHSDIDVISGQCRAFGYHWGSYMVPPSPLREYTDFLKVGSNWMSEKLIVQPEAFFRKRAYETVGGVPASYYAPDGLLWLEMARAKCKFYSVNRHWANIRWHKGRKTETNELGYAEVSLAAWKYLIKDWDALGDDVKLVADDIFKAMNILRESYVKKNDHLNGILKSVLRSPALKIGSFITRFIRFWKFKK